MRGFVGVAALAALLLALLVVPSSEAAEPDFTLTLRPGQPPSFQASLVSADLRAHAPGEHLEYNLTTPKGRLIGRIVSHGYFDVERARQVVPEVDAHFLFDAPRSDVVDPRSGGRLVNVTKSGSTVTLDVAFFVQGGRTTLNLTRDVTPPTFEVGDAYNVSPHGFLLKTETSEYTLAWLWYWPALGNEPPIPLPTTLYALEQTFPVQGLDENTSYAYRIDFFDWAKNRASSGEYRVTTPPIVRGPEPVVLSRLPEGLYPQGTVLRVVEANFSTPVGTIEARHVRLFVDLTEVTHEAMIAASSIRYVAPQPFAAGFHRVSLELANSENGLAVERWTFCVGHCEVAVGESEERAPVPVALVLAALGLAAVWLRRRAA